MDARHPAEWARDRSPWSIAPSQVIAVGLVAASIGWAAWLLRDRPTNDEVELLAGMTLPSSEMALMEAAFDRAQLTDHHTESGRVFVPRSRQSAYMRALVDAEALPREFGGSLRRALEKNSPWQSRAVQDERLRVATQEELALVICSMPGIERAAVLYDTESNRGFETGGPAKTASVNVRTQPDAELDLSRVQAIRVLVSASIAGLAPERVAVTDLRSGRVYAGPLEPDPEKESQAIAATDPVLARKIAHENHLAAKVRQALAFVKGATVEVSMEFAVSDAGAAADGGAGGDGGRGAEAEASVPDQKLADANVPAEIRPRSAIVVAAPPPVASRPSPSAPAVGDGPEALVVSIAIPDSYFHAAWRAAADCPGSPPVDVAAVEAREMGRIRQFVESLLPTVREPLRRRVTVVSFPTGSTASARRDLARPPAAGSMESAAGRDVASPGDGPIEQGRGGVDDMLLAVASGRFDEVPRQVWLAAASITVGLLAGFLWWAGGRREPPSGGRWSRSRTTPPQIDWSAGIDATDSGLEPTGGPAGMGRSAAMAAVCLVAAASASLADEGPRAAQQPVPATAAIAPLPEALLAEARSADDLGSAVGPRQARGPAVPETPFREVPPSTDRAGAAVTPQVLPAVPLGSGGAGERTAQAALPGGPGQLSDWKLLAVIVAAFAVVASATFVNRRRATVLPPDVFEVLGEGGLGGQHGVRVVRFGPKTLLVSVSSAGCRTLAELSDPQATACIAAACRGVQPPLRPSSRPRQLRPPAPAVEAA